MTATAHISSHHPSFTEAAVAKAARWVRDQIGMEHRVFCDIGIRVGYRRRSRRNGGDNWGGWYRPAGKLVEVLIGRDVTYPAPLWHNREEEAGGDKSKARDEWELFVAMLAHEMEHARCFAIARDPAERRWLNSEPRVRAVERRVMLAFRDAREALLAGWLREPERVERPAKPQPSTTERRAARAVELLAQWERRLKTAKTKVAKYRKKVGYYNRAAAKKKSQ